MDLVLISTREKDRNEVEIHYYPSIQHATFCTPAEELYNFASTMLPRVTEAPHNQLALDGRLIFCNSPAL